MTVWQFIVLHSTMFTLGVYYVFSAAVSSMPDLDTSSSKGYAWLFKFMHIIAGDISSGLSSKLPPPPPPLPPGVGTATQK